MLPVVRDAERRGVLFDVGFGAFNFGWDLAEKCFAQDLRPHIVSSDLQQFNVLGPVKSLANILGIFLHLGMSLGEVIETITDIPARALGLADTVGSLATGMPADITVFDIEEGDFEAFDTYAVSRRIARRFVPVLAFKDGVRYEIDMELCQDERNWMMQIAEDHVPAAAARLTGRQREFLGALRLALEPYRWTYSLDDMDLATATALQGRGARRGPADRHPAARCADGAVRRLPGQPLHHPERPAPAADRTGTSRSTGWTPSRGDCRAAA